MPTPTLPEEVLANILEHLGFDHYLQTDDAPFDVVSYRTLQAICLASRTFRQIARPLCYRAIFLGRTAQDPKFIARPSRFLELLSRHPEILTEIRGIRSGLNPSPYLDDPTGEHRKRHQTLLQSVRSLDMHGVFASEWIDAFERMRNATQGSFWGDENDIMNFIVCLCYNLEIWKLDEWGGVSRWMTSKLLVDHQAQRRVATPLQGLPLRRLRILALGRGSYGVNGIWGMPVQTIAQFAALPRLAKLQLHRVGQAFKRDVPYAQLGIERLALSAAHTTRDAIEWVAHSCPRLKELVIEWERSCRPLTFPGGQLGEALRALAPSLTHLTLRHGCENAMHVPPSAFAVGSLRALTSLRSLSISSRLLVGQLLRHGDCEGQPLLEILPLSLEVLVIHDFLDLRDHASERVDEWVIGLLISDEFSALHRLRLYRGWALAFAEAVGRSGWKCSYCIDKAPYILLDKLV